MQENKKTIVSNFLYNAVYRILVMFIPLITTPYITRTLGAEELGRFTFSYSIATYFALFILLGVENYGNRTIAASRENKKTLDKNFWEIYTMQLLAATIVIVMYIAYLLLFAKDINVASVMIIYIIGEALNINWAFFGMEKFKLITIRNAIIKLLSVVCIFLFVKDDGDVIAYSIINVVGVFASQIFLWINVCTLFGFRKVKIKDALMHLKQNLVLFIPVIAVSLYTVMDKIMIGVLSTNSDLGLYEASEKIVNIPNILVVSLGTVMLPRISNMIANGETKGSREYLFSSVKFAMFLVTSVGFGIMAIGREFVPVFYGPGYELCEILYYILIPSRFFMAFANVIRTQYLIPLKRDKIYIVSVILGAVVNLIANALLIPKYQSVGAAFGTLIAELTVCLVQCFAVRKELPMLRLISYAIPYFTIGLLMFILLTFIPTLSSKYFTIAIKVLIGVAFYISILGVMYLVKKGNSQKRG